MWIIRNVKNGERNSDETDRKCHEERKMRYIGLRNKTNSANFLSYGLVQIMMYVTHAKNNGTAVVIKRQPAHFTSHTSACYISHAFDFLCDLTFALLNYFASVISFSFILVRLHLFFLFSLLCIRISNEKRDEICDRIGLVIDNNFFLSILFLFQSLVLPFCSNSNLLWKNFCFIGNSACVMFAISMALLAGAYKFVWVFLSMFLLLIE